ncbi:hypothetical protein [Nostoc sp. KVJ20]|uniref:TRADD-N-associated membrane domain-containing protein n=1 Tax=Nostoc sp. KVJ20 TaxID=457944 RepID=UPI0021089BFD|nr:hypothetical protein [Nostoc sp. KVJ20]
MKAIFRKTNRPTSVVLNQQEKVEQELPSNGQDLNLISSNSIHQERLRQARVSFNLAFGLTAASGLISFVGVILLFSGNVSVGTVTAVGAVTAGTVSGSCLRLAKDANNRLNDTAKALDNEEDES